MSNEDKLLHRDDLPMDEVAAIEAIFAKTHPGKKVVFAGDDPSVLPPEIAERLKAIKVAEDKSLFNGTCFDCGAQMPNWPPPEDESIEWSPAKGWGCFTKSGEIAFWQCPDCDSKERSKGST